MAPPDTGADVLSFLQVPAVRKKKVPPYNLPAAFAASNVSNFPPFSVINSVERSTLLVSKLIRGVINAETNVFTLNNVDKSSNSIIEYTATFHLAQV